MGLLLPTTLPSGFDAEYYKILELLDNRRHLICTLGLFKSKDNSDEGKSSIQTVEIIMPSPSLEILTDMNHIEYAYDHIKKLESFKESTDC